MVRSNPSLGMEVHSFCGFCILGTDRSCLPVSEGSPGRSIGTPIQGRQRFETVGIELIEEKESR